MPEKDAQIQKFLGKLDATYKEFDAVMKRHDELAVGLINVARQLQHEVNVFKTVCDNYRKFGKPDNSKQLTLFEKMAKKASEDAKAAKKLIAVAGYHTKTAEAGVKKAEDTIKLVTTSQAALDDSLKKLKSTTKALAAATP